MIDRHYVILTKNSNDGNMLRNQIGDLENKLYSGNVKF